MSFLSVCPGPPPITHWPVCHGAAGCVAAGSDVQTETEKYDNLLKDIPPVWPVQHNALDAKLQAKRIAANGYQQQRKCLKFTC